DSAQAHFLLAQAHRRQGLVRSERQDLTEALRLEPSLLAARLSLARSFTSKRETKAALDVLDETPPAQKNIAGVSVKRNWALLAAGNYQEARSRINELLKAIRLPEGVLQEGLLDLQEHDYTHARSDAQELLQKDPQNLRAARL